MGATVGMNDWQGKPKYSEKTCPVLLCQPHMIRSDLEPGPSRWEAANRPSYDTLCQMFTTAPGLILDRGNKYPPLHAVQSDSSIQRTYVPAYLEAENRSLKWTINPYPEPRLTIVGPEPTFPGTLYVSNGLRINCTMPHVGAYRFPMVGQ
jgi:hypothetical protein